jgi:polyribonucleotide nucleotidyltransferase
VDERGRVRLSIRALLPQPERSAPAQETEAAGESSAE